MSDFLTAEDIQKADDVHEEVVEVPLWGGKVLVRSLTKGQMDRIKKDTPRGDDDTMDTDAFEKAVFLAGLVNPKLTEEDYDTWLAGKSAKPYMDIVNTIFESSGMADKAVTKEEKRFPAGQ